MCTLGQRYEAEDIRRKAGELQPASPASGERRLLAWTRISITIGALEFVVARFGEVNGQSLVLAGTVTGLLATLRFLQTGNDRDAGVVRFSPALEVALAVVFCVTGAVLSVYLIATA